VLIELENVEKRYQIGDVVVPALRGVSLSVDRGEYIAIMGSSGSGKSTLLHLIGCLDKPTSGRYRLAGRKIDGLSDDELSRVRNLMIGFVFQSFHLLPQLSVADNVEIPLLYRGVGHEERAGQIDVVLEQVGIAHRREHQSHELSGGEQQRVAIARALIGQPEIVLADEPTGNLDNKTGDGIMHLLQTLNRNGVTVIIVTHDVERARRAERILELSDGRWATGSAA